MALPEQTEIEKWHRRFAVDCNNLAFDLASKAMRSEAESREMLLAAHAAAFHWSKVGAPINQVRADFLLGYVHALLGDGAHAMHFAQRCINNCEAQPHEDWDIAFAHACVAFAAAISGDAALHAAHYALAEKLGHAIKDDEDRKVFFEEFARVPETIA